MFKKYQSMPVNIYAVQFTDKNKNQVLNSVTGQYAVDFDSDAKPILKVMNINKEVIILRLGNWLVKDEIPGTYYIIEDEVMRRDYV